MIVTLSKAIPDEEPRHEGFPGVSHPHQITSSISSDFGPVRHLLHADPSLKVLGLGQYTLSAWIWGTAAVSSSLPRNHFLPHSTHPPMLASISPTPTQGSLPKGDHQVLMLTMAPPQHAPPQPPTSPPPLATEPQEAEIEAPVHILVPEQGRKPAILSVAFRSVCSRQNRFVPSHCLVETIVLNTLEHSGPEVQGQKRARQPGGW